MNEPITTKTQMYKLLRSGRLGNTLRVWDTPEDVLKLNYRGNLSLRCTARRVPFRHNMPFAQALEEYQKPFHGCRPDQFLLCEPAPDEWCRIQGEVQDTPETFLFTWSTSKKNHRLAITDSENHAQGRPALVLLNKLMYGEDVEVLKELWETYPDHVIEFSVYSERVGIFGKHLVIWEVRYY